MCEDRFGQAFGLTYQQVKQITGYSLKTLYQYKSEGRLRPEAEGVARFSWESIWGLIYLRA